MKLALRGTPDVHPQARRLGMPRLPPDPVTRHPTVREEVASDLAGSERIDSSDLDACLETWTDLEDGLLIWDAGIGRLRFAVVHGIDGMYVEVLTGTRDATTLTAEAHGPIDFEVHHCGARSLSEQGVLPFARIDLGMQQCILVVTASQRLPDCEGPLVA
ncbi:hypothetical protein ACWECW_25195 [Rhodococcus ruber]